MKPGNLSMVLVVVNSFYNNALLVSIQQIRNMCRRNKPLNRPWVLISVLIKKTKLSGLDVPISAMRGRMIQKRKIYVVQVFDAWDFKIRKIKSTRESNASSKTLKYNKKSGTKLLQKRFCSFQGNPWLEKSQRKVLL